MPNVSERELNRLKNSVSELSALNQIANAINVTMSVDKITKIILDFCLKRINASQGGIFLLDEMEAQDKFKTFVRKIDSAAGEIPFHLNMELTGWMIKNKQILLSNDPDHDDRITSLDFKSMGIRSVLAAPLLSRNGLIGLLVVFNKNIPDGFDENDRRFLGIVGTQTAKVIENARLFESERELLAIQEELKVANSIQKGFLPEGNIKTPHYETYGFNTPAKDMGGDYYDLFQVDEERLFLSLGDVSGKGMPAALLMANAQAVLRSQLSKGGEIPLCRLAGCLNRLICQFTSASQYITGMVGLYDTTSGIFSYVNAGHLPPLVIRNNGVIDCPEESDLVIGVMPDYEYKVHEIKLAADETVFNFTDGITEAFNEKDEEFEMERLTKILRDNYKENPGVIGERVYREVLKFRGKREPSDDITMLILRAF